MLSPPPWPLGLVTTVLAGVLLWSVTARLRLRPETRAASTAMFACGALLAEVTTDGVDGRATLLLAVGGMLAAGGRVRSSVAALACVAAVLLAPVVAVGVLVLLGMMALRKDLATRFPAAVRQTVGWTSIIAAVAVAVALAEPAAEQAVPATVLAPLVAGTAVVGGGLWTRLPWLRPAVSAVAALAACLAVPGAGPAAVLPVTAGVAVLAAVLVEERRMLFARPVLVGATMAGVVGAALLVPDVVTPAPPAPALPVVPERPPERIPVAAPVSIAIPALGLTGPLAELIVADNGELLAPDDTRLAGWYTGGVVPGEVGPAIIGGHVDSRRGPGVFFALRSLTAGDVVEIMRADGSVARFAVTAVRQVPKEQFPTGSVYGATPRPELRLITCGGRFDRAVRSYADNVVVDAVVT